MKPQLETIPLHLMPTKRWWSSPHHSYWYYHTPREEVVPPNLEVLAKTLDPCLKELAITLNLLGCITLPSCQGMHDNNNNNDKRDKAYDYLLHDMQLIRTRGLTLTDVETGEYILYFDPSFRLPWKRSEFIKRDSKKNAKPKGYLPFFCFSRHTLDVLCYIVDRTKNTTLTCMQNPLGLICTLEVYGKNAGRQCSTWNTLYQNLVKYA